MTCRHSDPVNNRECSSYETPRRQAAELRKQLRAVLKLISSKEPEPEGACEAMTCRHKPGDPDCGSSPTGAARNAAYEVSSVLVDHKKLIEDLKRQLAEARVEVSAASPDASHFEIEDVQEVGPHLVVKAKFPNCRRCSYEGSKVLVFLNQTVKQAIRWRKLDPHFRETLPQNAAEAPSPDARFPASEQGWRDAVSLAEAKIKATVGIR